MKPFVSWKSDFQRVWSQLTVNCFRKKLHMEEIWNYTEKSTQSVAQILNWHIIQGNIFWSPRLFEDVFKTSLEHVFNVTISNLARDLEHDLKTSWHLQKRLEDVWKTFWKTKNCYDLEKLFLIRNKLMVIIILKTDNNFIFLFSLCFRATLYIPES